MNTIERLARYRSALEKWKKEFDYRGRLTGKDLERRNKKPMKSMPTPSLFEIAADDIYALKIKEIIIGATVKTPPPITMPPRKNP